MDVAGFHQHLQSGATTVCRCWSVTRRDGVAFGFTDHDRDLAFEGVIFRADTGLTARALAQSTGLSVDNTEALGALSDAAVTEADILAGRFDGAEVRHWLVNWQDVRQRALQFAGTIGEIRRGGGAFEAELRGRSELLNRPIGRVYQRHCPAVLGDAQCGVSLENPTFSVETTVLTAEDRTVLRCGGLGGFASGWFERGRLLVKTGAGAGLSAAVKRHRRAGGGAEIELWQALGVDLVPGDLIRLEAGCDKRAETCRAKFANFLNFRGFPHIPGEDWLTTFPARDGVNDGGSLNR